MTTKFIQKLKKRLELSLPGETSHQVMRPMMKNGGGIRFPDPKNPREGAVLILFYEKAGKIRFPLIQRPKYDGPHSGQISLPGGKWEEEDKDLFQTALREAEEEIGIVADRTEVIGSLSSFSVAASNHLVLPVIGFYPEIPSYIPDDIEVDEVIDVALEDLIYEGNVKRTDIIVGNNITLDSPYFDLGNKVVWGATAGMLAELRDVIIELERVG